jgi:hypothetical protein
MVMLWTEELTPAPFRRSAAGRPRGPACPVECAVNRRNLADAGTG